MFFVTDTCVIGRVVWKAGIDFDVIILHQLSFLYKYMARFYAGESFVRAPSGVGRLMSR